MNKHSCIAKLNTFNENPKGMLSIITNISLSQDEFEAECQREACNSLTRALIGRFSEKINTALVEFTNGQLAVHLFMKKTSRPKVDRKMVKEQLKKGEMLQKCTTPPISVKTFLPTIQIVCGYIVAEFLEAGSTIEIVEDLDQEAA